MFSGFSGRSDLVLDERGRVAFPKRYRNRLLELSNGKVWVTIGPLQAGRALYIYADPDWQALAEGLQQSDNSKQNISDVQWRMIGHAEEAALDGNGRLLIPQALREHAGLEKRIVLLGVIRRFELWDEGLYREEMARQRAESSMDGLEGLLY